MIFSALQDKEFFDKRDELAGLYRRVIQADKGLAQSAVLTGPRGIGKTELLKQLFGQLFWRQDRVVPFWYSVNPALLSLSEFSRSYLVRFLCHRLAFPKKEQALLHLDAITIEDLSDFAEEQGASWAKQVLDRYRLNAGSPLDALRIALNAPFQSMLATGMPVAVLIDEFQRLNGLHVDGAPDPRLVGLFAEPLGSGKTPHLITGNGPEIQEMAVSNGLERVVVQPLGTEGTAAKALALMSSQGAEGAVPNLLLRHLAGNPYYLTCVVRAAGARKNPDDKDFWNAYIREITQGSLSLFWSAVLKDFFPDLEMRRTALAVAHKIYHTAEPLSCQRIAKSFSLTDARAADTARALYLAGFIRGEFGVFRGVEDRVARDGIECLYLREILGKSFHDLEQHFLGKLLPQQEHVVHFDLTIPMVRESELVAAQCLEQIGKNLQLNEDIIGQMQIAVIETCINAIEHSKGMGSQIYVAVSVEGGRLEVSIESAGPEFIVQETGEPFADRDAAKASGRGWGIKLMKRFADEVKFERTPRGTRTVLIKNLGTSAGVQKEDTANRE